MTTGRACGPNVREKIFERFYTDRPHQGFGQNSGLGLSISKQIVEAHGGAIWVENRTGAPGPDGEPRVLGARFIVRLPALKWRSSANDVSVGNGPRLGRAGRRARGADPRSVGRRQIAAGARTDRGGARRRVLFARLVGDDRVHLEGAGGRLLVRPADALAGLHRTARRRHSAAAIMRPARSSGLVVDLGGRGRRTAAGTASEVAIEGMPLPRLAVAPGVAALPAVLAMPHVMR